MLDEEVEIEVEDEVEREDLYIVSEILYLAEVIVLLYELEELEVILFVLPLVESDVLAVSEV